MNIKWTGLFLLGAAALGCNTPSGSPSADAPSLGDNGNSNVSPDSQGRNGCEGNSPICIGVKYVVYENSSGIPVASAATAEKNIQTTNRIWRACGIAFQIESFSTVNPKNYALTYGGRASSSETYSVRRTFQENDTFLVATTGPWGTTKNAWTESPSGSGTYGVVMEASVAGNGAILAHELGHYLSLDHVSNPSNVLSAVIYPTSTQLTASQCAAARNTAKNFWPKMLR